MFVVKHEYVTNMSVHVTLRQSSTRSHARKRQHIIVVASLVDRVRAISFCLIDIISLHNSRPISVA